jgi:hypothetical protein
MRRLYLVLPDKSTCSALVDELEKAGVPERHLHVVANFGTKLDGLPEAGVLQKTEFGHGVEIGALLGAVAGLLGSLMAKYMPVPAIDLSLQAIALMTAAGAVFGALASGLMSKDAHNRKLDAFKSDLAHGRLLLLADIPKPQVAEWKKTILSHYPAARIGVAKVK